MALSKKLVEEFQALYLSIFGEAIEYDKAEFELKELAHLVRTTHKEDGSDEHGFSS